MKLDMDRVLRRAGVALVGTFAALVISALLVNNSFTQRMERAESPSTQALSQLMGTECPGQKSVLETQICTARVAATIESQSLRRFEVGIQFWQGWVAAVTTFLTFVGLGVGIVTLLYLRETLAQTARAAAAAETAGAAAIAANEGFALSAERQLRAYVYLSSATIRTQDEKREASIAFENKGATPARGVVVKWHAAVQKAGLPKIALPEKAVVESVGDLAPTASLRTGLVLQADEISAFLKAAPPGTKVEIVVWGAITYTDAFNVPRTTEFRWRQDLRDDGLRDEPLKLCSDGNSIS